MYIVSVERQTHVSNLRSRASEYLSNTCFEPFQRCCAFRSTDFGSLHIVLEQAICVLFVSAAVLAIYRSTDNINIKIDIP